MENVDFKELAKTLGEIANAALQARMDSLKGKVPERLREAMAYSLLAPGKRIRPILVFLGASAVVGENAWNDVTYRGKLTCAAMAIEMIHAYSLIHDDLPAMDNDDYRRGRPTNHKQFDEATAILAGDGLLTCAFEVLTDSRLRAEETRDCVAFLAQAAGPAGMVGGQMDDIYHNSEGAGEAFTRNMQRNKTGQLLAAALKMGVCLAGGSEKQVEQIEKYGFTLGAMFQLTDDLLDLTSTQEEMGKGVHKDQEQGKLTLIQYCGIKGARELLREMEHEAAEYIDQEGMFAETSYLCEILEYVRLRRR